MAERFIEASRQFADAELRIRELNKAVNHRNCPAYQDPEEDVGFLGGRCEDLENCAGCRAINEAWHDLARVRKVRHAARRRMLAWREREKGGKRGN